MDGILRRRGLEEGGAKTVILGEKTLTQEATSIETDKIHATVFADPRLKKVIIKVYAVTPESGQVSQYAQLVMRRTGIGRQLNFYDTWASGTKRQINCGTGDDITTEGEMVHGEGLIYSYASTINTGQSFSGTFTFKDDVGSFFFALEGATALGVGTRIVVYGEYE